MRVLFCHQSVGANIIQGVVELGSEGFAGRICDLPSSKQANDARQLVHEKVGRNGNPVSKLRDFEIKVQSPPTELDFACLSLLRRRCRASAAETCGLSIATSSLTV